MKKGRRAYCEWCGEDLDCAYAGPESCGKTECNREVTDMVCSQDEDARLDAEEDGYSRYGGSGGW